MRHFVEPRRPPGRFCRTEATPCGILSNRGDPLRRFAELRRPLGALRDPLRRFAELRRPPGGHNIKDKRTMDQHYVAYYRVSTKKQAHGIAAQRSQVKAFTENKGHIIGEFKEKESGENNFRPQLNAAIQYCEKHSATLLIAKLDRLSRDVAFLFTLRDQLKKAGVEIIVVDMPDLIGNTMMLGIFAAVAQHELEIGSERTREGLKAAKAKGIILGRKVGHEVTEITRERISASLKATKKAHREATCARAIDIIKTSLTYGATYPQICTQLNVYKIPTVGGIVGNWTPPQICRLVKQIA